MRRSVYPTLLAFGLACAAIGCLKDLDDLCQTDGDCPVGQRCRALHGVKYCVGDSTGPGGTGGTGGTGGGGGGVEFQAVVDVELRPDADLADFLGRHERKVSAIAFRYSSGGADRHVEFPLSEPSSLPIGPVEAQLPLSSEAETLEVKVEARVVRLDEVVATFALGEVTEEFSIHERASVSVDVSLDEAFDWDVDGDFDVSDCDPDDPEVFDGAKDWCDGKRQACGQDYCLIRLDDDQTVRDLACSPAERKCAVVVEGPAASVVRIYEPSFSEDPVELEGVTGALGVEWSKDGSGEYLIVIEEGRVLFSSPTGEVSSGHLSPVGNLSGSLSVSAHGTVAAAPLARPLMLQLFDPRTARSSAGVIECDTANSDCTTLNATDFVANLGAISNDALIRQVVVYNSVAGGDSALYLLFDGDERVGLARVDADRKMQQDKSGFVFGGAPHFGFVAPFANKTRLFAGAGHDSDSSVAFWARMSLSKGTQQDLSPVVLPEGSCPSAIDSQRSDTALLMADDCTGSLWEIPLDEEGRPLGEGFEQYRLADCAEPFVLASLPAAGEQEAVTFVGCKGENHILVHGGL